MGDRIAGKKSTAGSGEKSREMGGGDWLSEINEENTKNKLNHGKHGHRRNSKIGIWRQCWRWQS